MTKEIIKQRKKVMFFSVLEDSIAEYAPELAGDEYRYRTVNIIEFDTISTHGKSKRYDVDIVEILCDEAFRSASN